MSIPKGDIGKYAFNPEDDRAATRGGYGEQYLALATADDQVDGVIAAHEATGFSIDPKALTALKTARSAIRRAAMLIVLHHGVDEEGRP